jgi:non-ribosomal peptide synthetase component F
MGFLAGQHVRGRNRLPNPSLTTFGDSDGERQRQLAGRNDTGVPVPPMTLPGLAEAQAGRSPGAPAAASAAGVPIYAELSHRANKLAHHLIGLGAGPERVVALRAGGSSTCTGRPGR